MKREIHRLVCRHCGYKIVPAHKIDREETGVLFRHQLRDKKDECDMEGDHEAEPKVVDPNGVIFREWVMTYRAKLSATYTGGERLKFLLRLTDEELRGAMAEGSARSNSIVEAIGGPGTFGFDSSWVAEQASRILRERSEAAVGGGERR